MSFASAPRRTIVSAALVGAYWEEFIIQDQMNFNYLAIPQCDAANLAISLAGGPDCVAAVGPIPGYYATDPGLRTELRHRVR